MHLALLLASIGPDSRTQAIRALLMMAGVTVGIASLVTFVDRRKYPPRNRRRFRNMLGTYDTVIIRPGSAKAERGVAHEYRPDS